VVQVMRMVILSRVKPESDAEARLRDGGHNTVLDTTSLVHESYLRFVHAGELRAEDRRAFFAYASQVMRSVIVNSVRERIAQKETSDDSDRLDTGQGKGGRMKGDGRSCNGPVRALFNRDLRKPDRGGSTRYSR
jgi:ECF sigma factor